MSGIAIGILSLLIAGLIGLTGYMYYELFYKPPPPKVSKSLFVGPNHPTRRDTDAGVLWKDATFQEQWLQLNQDQTGSTGTAHWKTYPGTSFTLSFVLQVNKQNAVTSYGDETWVAFYRQLADVHKRDADAPVTGYSIAFNEWHGDTVSLSYGPNVLASTTGLTQWTDGKPHSVRIECNQGSFLCYLDEICVLQFTDPIFLTRSKPQDDSQVVFGAWSGASTAQHTVQNIVLEPLYCPN